MKGLKTIVAAASIFVLGGLQSPAFKDSVGGCVFEVSAMQPDTCVFPASVVMSIAVLMLALRWLTTSPLPWLKDK